MCMLHCACIGPTEAVYEPREGFVDMEMDLFLSIHRAIGEDKVSPSAQWACGCCMVHTIGHNHGVERTCLLTQQLLRDMALTQHVT